MVLIFFSRLTCYQEPCIPTCLTFTGRDVSTRYALVKYLPLASRAARYGNICRLLNAPQMLDILYVYLTPLSIDVVN